MCIARRRTSFAAILDLNAIICPEFVMIREIRIKTFDIPYPMSLAKFASQKFVFCAKFIFA